ncbi:BAX inhibitor (BI)-1/YccA family protein [Lactobacillus sp. S2-2]|uniref:Bax inhibitor-1/YccA family protein n=1 Tax=Lactobacillus sp. S2-2 TaxID=2692917 RepID=UPI001F36BE6C|nr:Bax inhibitor-1/YccA family protein [Lactobacillus sp. S2-2]MCF6515155.1 BAX inhibitor (BI)-1/YccA family protein [Lactobacillus sp. S2-2]
MENYNERRIVGNKEGINKFFAKTYAWMGLAVLVSGIFAFLTATVWSNQLANVYGSSFKSILMFVVLIGFSFAINHAAIKNPVLGFVLLMGFAAFMGFSLGSIFLVYSIGNIASAFIGSASIFGSMSLFGLLTKRDLTSVGTQVYAALIGVIVASVVNLFLRSSMIVLVISIITVIIFTLLTAYDTQKLKSMYNNSDEIGVSASSLAVIGAMDLYMDFLNLFINLLQILGIFGGDDN